MLFRSVRTTKPQLVRTQEQTNVPAVKEALPLAPPNQDDATPGRDRENSANLQPAQERAPSEKKRTRGRPRKKTTLLLNSNVADEPIPAHLNIDASD